LKDGEKIKEKLMKLSKDNDEELLESRKLGLKQQKEIARLEQELEQYKSNEKKQKFRIKQLENELETALKRPASRSSFSRTSSPSPCI